MITKAQVKHIQSLDDKKYRNEHHEFVVEGEKMVLELLQSEFRVHQVFALPSWISENNKFLSTINTEVIELFELERISSMKTPNKVLAVAGIPLAKNTEAKLALLLDGIQDPGNVGSIIRIADWYNMDAVYCSETCADVFNPKVIQASMGSIFRMHVKVCDIEKLLNEQKDIPSYVSVLYGEDVNSYSKINKGYIIIGNESKGVSQKIISSATHKISIQRKGRAESLNAAVATGIICHCMLS